MPEDWSVHNHFGHPPSFDVFFHFFEDKSPRKNIWVSFSGMVGRVLLTLFQQSYKGFKGKFLRVGCSMHDPTLQDGLPLYWVREQKLKKSKTLEELAPPDREVCQVLASLGAVFNTAQLIKYKYDVGALKGYIGTNLSFVLPCCVSLLCLYLLLAFSCILITLLY